MFQQEGFKVIYEKVVQDPEKEGDKDEISPFKEIIFTELQREEAATIVAEYNKVCI